MERVPSNILLGAFCGLVALYFIRSMTACEYVFRKLKNHSYAKLALGGIILSTLIFLFPSLYGEGYKDINILLDFIAQPLYQIQTGGVLLRSDDALG